MATRSSGREAGRGLEARVKPADGEHEVGLGAEVGAQGHAAGDGEGGDLRVVEHRVERDVAGGEIDDADRVELEPHDRRRSVGKQDAQATEDQQAYRRG